MQSLVDGFSVILRFRLSRDDALHKASDNNPRDPDQREDGICMILNGKLSAFYNLGLPEGDQGAEPAHVIYLSQTIFLLQIANPAY